MGWRVAKIAGAILLWTTIGVAALLLSILIHVRSSVSKEFVRVIAQDLVRENVRGRLTIGRIDRLTPRHVEVSDVKIFDAQGREVIRAARVRADLNLSALARGVIHVPYAEIIGAHLVLIRGHEETPTFLEAFEPLHPNLSPDAASPHVLIDRIDLRPATAEGEVKGIQGIQIRDLQARARFDLHEELNLSIVSAHAEMFRPYAPSVMVRSVEGAIHSDPARGITLLVLADSGPNDHVRAHVEVHPRDAEVTDSETRVDVLARLDPVGVETLRGANIPGLDRVQGSVRGYARLYGPVSNLAFTGSLTHEAGAVAVTGSLSDEHGVLVNARTSGVDLDRLIVGLPPGLRIGGDGHLRIENVLPGGTNPHFQAEVNAFMFNEWAIPSFTTEGEISPTVVHIARVDLLHDAGVIHGQGEISTEEDGRIDFDVEATLPQIAREPNVHRLVPSLRAGVSAQLHIHTSSNEDGPRAIDVDGAVALRNLSYNAIRARTLHARGHMHLAGATPTVRGNVSAQSLQIAEVDFGDGTVSVAGGPSLYRTSGRFATEDRRSANFDATIGVAANNTISIDAPRVEFAIGDSLWRGMIQRMVIVPGRSIETQMLRLANGPQRLEAHGRVAFHSAQNMEVVLQDFDISAANTLFGDRMPRLVGNLDTHLVMGGTLSQPTISVEGALHEGCIDQVDGLEMVFRVTYENGNLEIDQQVDMGERGNLALSGQGTLSPQISNPLTALREGQYALALDIGEVRVSVLHPYLPEKLHKFGGSLDGHVEFQGTLAHPTLSVDTALTTESILNLPPLVVALTGNYDESLLGANIVLRDGDHDLAQLEIRYESNASLLIGTKRMFFDALRVNPWRLQLNVPNQRTEELSPLLRSLVRDLPIEASLTLMAQHGARGVNAELSSRAIWHDDLSTMPCGQHAQPRVEVQATLNGAELRASATGYLTENERAFEMTATTALDIDAWLRDMQLPTALPATEIDVNLPGLELSQVPYACNKFSGPIRGTVHAAQIFTDNHMMRASLRADGLTINNGPLTNVELSANASTRAIVADLALTAPDSDSQAQVQATMEIEWPTLRPVPIVHSDGRFLLLGRFEQAQVAPLLAVIPGIADAAMLVNGTLQAQGTRDELTWNGDLEISEGELELVGPGQRLDNVVGHIGFSEDRAHIESLNARDIEGSIAVTGDMIFKGVLPRTVELNVDTNVFPIRRDGLVLATMTGRAHVRATSTSEQTEIQVGVQDLSIRLPDESDQDIQSLDANPDIVVIGEEREEGAGEEAHPFHVIIDASQPFWVRRSDFAAQVRANLDVTYRDPVLRVGGYVNLQRGFFEIFGKRFNLSRGSMVFDDSSDLNPDLDIIAIYTLPGGTARTVTVTVSGRLSNPQIDFSTSEQTTDRGEIISLLLSGRTSISQGGSSASAADAQQQAASFVSGVLAGVLTLGLRRQFGELFPVISIESGDSAFTSARVRVGFQAESFIRDNLPWLTGFVQGAYFEGFAAVASSDQSNSTVTTTQGAAPFGGLLELNLPHSWVFTGTVRSSGSWGVDLTYQP